MVRKVWVCFFLSGIGCQDGGDSGGTGVKPIGPAGTEEGTAIPPDAAVEPPPWDELAEPQVDLGGGSATSVGGVAADGSDIELRAHVLRFDGAGVLPPVPAVPEAPAAGVAVGIGELAADVTQAETVRLGGTLVGGGTDAVRTITSSAGDVVIEGDLYAARLSEGTQSLTVRAPAGTVFVHGAIDTRGRLEGFAAGAIRIEAQHIVVTGALIAAGERGVFRDGGAGGAITLHATGSLLVAGGGLSSAGGTGELGVGGDGGAIELRGTAVVLDGPIDSLGGDGRGDGDASGGDGGAITIRASTDLQIGSSVRLRGGAAVTTGSVAIGGAAGDLTIDAPRFVRIGATIDGRGGLARADVAGGTVTGGTPAELQIGGEATPDEIAFYVPLRAHGGDGEAHGGDGGDLTMDTSGPLLLGGLIELDGGDSALEPGDAGTVAGEFSGDLHISGRLVGRGGSATGDVQADGGDGSKVALQAMSTGAGLTVTASGALELHGGDASGAGRAGGGGDMALHTHDGNVSMAGQLLARGGASPGGEGGQGGILDLFSDDNHNGVGGDLTIESTGLIDVSGGPGATGGSARNNGGAGVAMFPTHQEDIAVLLNSDGMHGGPTNGVLINHGMVIARGGASDGWGGDVMFHGRQEDADLDPDPGMMDLSGDGDGHDGYYAGE
jgi:hypothetical protein